MFMAYYCSALVINIWDRSHTFLREHTKIDLKVLKKSEIGSRSETCFRKTLPLASSTLS